MTHQRWPHILQTDRAFSPAQEMKLPTHHPKMAAWIGFCWKPNCEPRFAFSPHVGATNSRENRLHEQVRFASRIRIRRHQLTAAPSLHDSWFGTNNHLTRNQNGGGTRLDSDRNGSWWPIHCQDKVSWLPPLHFQCPWRCRTKNGPRHAAGQTPAIRVVIWGERWIVSLATGMMGSGCQTHRGRRPQCHKPPTSQAFGWSPLCSIVYRWRLPRQYCTLLGSPLRQANHTKEPGPGSSLLPDAADEILDKKLDSPQGSSMPCFSSRSLCRCLATPDEKCLATQHGPSVKRCSCPSFRIQALHWKS